MRRFCLILLAALLVVPAAALAGPASRTAPGDGSLVVIGANGKLIVQGRGLIYGHLDKGTIIVNDYKPDDTTAPSVSGAKVRVVGSTVVYTGTDVRFLFPGGKYSLELDGSVMDVSAVGRGAVVALGQDGIDDGTLAVDGGIAQPLGTVPVTSLFGRGASVNASPAAASLVGGGSKSH